MGDLKPVIEAILADAKANAAEIKEAAVRRVEVMHTEFEEEKRREKERFEKELAEETERIYVREGAKNRQLLKDAQLSARADSVKAAVNTAKKRIIALEDNSYADFCGRLYKNIGESGTVFLNERDKKRIKKDTFAGSKISDKDLSASGGFVLACGKIEYDCTVDSLFAEKYNEICDKISAVYAEGGR